ncbi:MarR family transcriptional regulator, partial [Vibrio sp.]|nr:MarR family transcriptional regulator [Vibrio sp.]
GEQRARDLLKIREGVTLEVIDCLTSEQQSQLTHILETVLTKVTTDIVDARGSCRLCDESICKDKGCPIERGMH